MNKLTKKLGLLMLVLVLALSPVMMFTGCGGSNTDNDPNYGELKMYTIVFNGNGNTDGSTASITAIYDVTYTLTENGFTKDGYIFVGWATSIDGDVVYADKASVKNLATSGTVTLYAKWTVIVHTMRMASQTNRTDNLEVWNGMLSITHPLGEGVFVPGTPLNHSALNILNQASTSTYIVIVYKLETQKDGEDIANEITDLPALSFDGVEDDWTPIEYTCKNTTETTVYSCLVGVNPFVARQNHPDYIKDLSLGGYIIPVFGHNSISIPTSWDNRMQGCKVTISIAAYAVQSELGYEFDELLKNASTEQKAQLITEKVLTICGVDMLKINFTESGTSTSSLTGDFGAIIPNQTILNETYTVGLCTNVKSYMRVKISAVLDDTLYTDNTQDDNFITADNIFTITAGSGWYKHTDGYFYMGLGVEQTAESVNGGTAQTIDVCIKVISTVGSGGSTYFANKTGRYTIQIEAIQADYIADNSATNVTILGLATAWAQVCNSN